MDPIDFHLLLHWHSKSFLRLDHALVPILVEVKERQAEGVERAAVVVAVVDNKHSIEDP